MKKITIFIITIIIFFGLQWQDTRVNATDFYNYAAEFVYKFPNMIKNKSGGLCVYGYDQVSVWLDDHYRGNVVFFKNNDDLKNFHNQNCKVLYVSKNIDKDYSAIEVANKYKVVSIGLDENFINNGGVILMQIGRRNFDLIANKNKIKLYDIKFDYMASHLLVN